MNAVTWKQVDISDETEELIKASIAPSTIQTYRRAVQQLEIWLDGRTLSGQLTRKTTSRGCIRTENRRRQSVEL